MASFAGLLACLAALGACKEDAAPDDGDALGADAGSDGGDEWGQLAKNNNGLGDGGSVDAKSVAAPPDALMWTLGTPQQACGMLAENRCKALFACAPFHAGAQLGTQAECLERTRQTCLLDLQATDTGQSVPGVVRCAQEISNATCSDLVERRNLDTCLPMGQRANDLPCTRGVQCGSGYCRIDKGCGTCASRIALGGACESDEACLPGHVCSAEKKCAAPRDLGATCEPRALPCHAGLSCVNGRCVQPLAAGKKCEDTAQCATLQGETCLKLPGAETKTCVRTRLAAVGQPCGVVEGQPVGCYQGALMDGQPLCREANDGVDRCVAPAREGDRCGDEADGLPCQFPTVCAQGTCRMPTCN